jgi:hypothetical protein
MYRYPIVIHPKEGKFIVSKLLWGWGGAWENPNYWWKQDMNQHKENALFCT